MLFHEVLNEYVSTIGITYKALADEAGMTAGVISRYKNGSRLPSVRTGAARKLSEAVAKLAVDHGLELSEAEIEERFLKAIAEESESTSSQQASAGQSSSRPASRPRRAQASDDEESQAGAPKPGEKDEAGQEEKPSLRDKIKTYRRARGIRKAQVKFYESVLKDPEIKRVFIYQALPEELDRNYLTEILAGDVHVFLVVHTHKNVFRMIKAFIDWWPLYRSGRLHLYVVHGSADPKVFGRGIFYTKKTALTIECMGGDLHYGKAYRIDGGKRLASIRRRMAFLIKLSTRII